MSDLYNVRLSYKGERDFTFMLPKYGELTIYTGKDIYVKGINVDGVEALRQLRVCLLDHQINAKPDGCYRVIDLNTIQEKTFGRMNYRQEKPVAKSISELKSEMVKSEGPILEETFEIKLSNENDSNLAINNSAGTLTDSKLEDYVLISTKHKGKSLKQLTKQQLKQNQKWANEEDKVKMQARMEELNDFNK